jgi:hypothetical protein
MPGMPPKILRAKLRAAAIHLALSLLVAALIALVVFKIWFPPPYSTFSGGQELFLLVISVDIVIGPLLTAVAFSPLKTRRHLAYDLGMIAALQCAAMAYGLHTVYIARPVVLVYEVDRFRVIAASDVSVDELPDASPEFRSLPILGPQLIGTRKPISNDEKIKAIDMALQGIDVGQRPSFWCQYGLVASDAVLHSQPAESLIKQSPNLRSSIENQLASIGAKLPDSRYLPVQTKHGEWVVVIKEDGTPLGFVDLGSSSNTR